MKSARFLKKRRKLFLYGGIFLLLALVFVAALFLRKSSSESDPTSGGSQAGAGGASTTHVSQVQTVPLSQEEINTFSNALLSSEFLKALPEKYPVAITFYDFETGERRWRSSFLFNNKGFLSNGEPEISIIISAKYIPELSNSNFCDIVKKAKQAGDLGFNSESSTVSLLFKYSGMLKYRDCFGF